MNRSNKDSKSTSLSKSSKDKLEIIKKNIQARKITNKFKSFISPYINRVSAKIESRIEYYNKLFKILNEINEEQCLNLINRHDSRDKHGIDIIDKQYTLGDNMEILLTKQIGSPSAYGAIYLSKINIKYNQLYKFAIKIFADNDINKIEIRLVKFLSYLVLNNINPHFLIFYKLFNCDKHELEYGLYPNVIIDKEYFGMLIELANGDLQTFLSISDNYSNYELMKNTFQQFLITILSFHNYTNQIHIDAHSGNFLYHKIKEGGYIHYKIFGIDVYIKNVGYLWIIWDYVPRPLNSSNFCKDYKISISEFVKTNKNHLEDYLVKQNPNYIRKKITDLNFIKECNEIIDIIKSNSIIKNSDYELWTMYILKKSIFQKELIKPPNNEIINFGNPYVLK
jgi:hypothetical protein